MLKLLLLVLAFAAIANCHDDGANIHNAVNKDYPYYEPTTTEAPTTTEEPVGIKDILYNLDLQSAWNDKLAALGSGATAVSETVQPGLTVAKDWLNDVALPAAVLGAVAFAIYTAFRIVFGLFGTVLGAKGTIITSLLGSLKDVPGAIAEKFFPEAGESAKVVVNQMMDRLAKRMDVQQLLGLASQVAIAMEKYENLQPQFQNDQEETSEQ